MASPIQGKDVVLEFSSDSGTTWKSLICEISSSFSGSRETNSITTKCDSGTVTRALGAYSWEFSGDAAADTAPTSAQLSYSQVLTWFVGGTAVDVRYQSSASTPNYYHTGEGYFTSLELSNEVNGVSEFSFTFSGNGALDITA
jgi:TP901-1 family phage major tail protein